MSGVEVDFTWDVELGFQEVGGSVFQHIWRARARGDTLTEQQDGVETHALFASKQNAECRMLFEADKRRKAGYRDLVVPSVWYTEAGGTFATSKLTLHNQLASQNATAENETFEERVQRKVRERYDGVE